MTSTDVAAGALHTRDFDPKRWAARTIRTGRHCFGCSAGAGSLPQQPPSPDVEAELLRRFKDWTGA